MDLNSVDSIPGVASIGDIRGNSRSCAHMTDKTADRQRLQLVVQNRVSSVCDDDLDLLGDGGVPEVGWCLLLGPFAECSPQRDAL